MRSLFRLAKSLVQIGLRLCPELWGGTDARLRGWIKNLFYNIVFLRFFVLFLDLKGGGGGILSQKSETGVLVRFRDKLKTTPQNTWKLGNSFSLSPIYPLAPP